jgi:PIN domain nuclease of toxin-antitoxin system
MRYLLDTHTLIWHLEDSPRLPQKMRKIINNSNGRIYLCSASLWEIAIKVGIGKLEFSFTFEELLDKVQNGDYNVLQIKDAYLKRLAALPLIHKDPFDRLLVSTALVEKLTIISADENVRMYDVPCDW